jgi:hypothetical protein
MAYTILWMDGFDEIYSVDQKYTKGGEASVDADSTITGNTPFNYGRAHRLAKSFSQTFLQKAITSGPYTVFFLGFHVFTNFNDTPERNFIQFLDAQNNVVQIELRRIWDNVLLKHVLRLYRGSTLLGTTSDGIPQNTWVWLSVKHVCSQINGVVEVKINNATVLTYNGNTQNGAANQVHRPAVFSGAPLNPGEFNIDNLVIATGLAADPPLPECRIFGAVVPTSNFNVQFTPNAGTNWSNVNEIPPNDDTSYNSSNTVGATDMFVCAPPTLTGVIPAVKINFRARKDDAGVREIAPIIRPGTTNQQGAAIEITSNYFNRGYMWTTNPDTGQAWNPGDIANLKFGYRIVT